MDLEEFAPSVDIQKELDAAPDSPTIDLDKPVDEPVSQEPEVKASETPETPETKEPEQKQVPLAALAEARRQAKEMRAKAEESERIHAQQIADLNAKLEKLINPPSPVPSFDENPAENLRQRQERLEAENAQRQEYFAQQQRQQEEQQKQQQVIGYISSEMEKAETEFTAKTPDYLEAVSYLRQVSEKNLRAQGVTNPADIQRITYEQALGMAANAIKSGLNPAEVAYNFAKNYGYQHKVDATKQVKAMAEAQSRTQNMGNGKSDVPFSIAALASMDNEQLDEVIANDKNWAKIVRQS